jgi:hypothetical protein
MIRNSWMHAAVTANFCLVMPRSVIPHFTCIYPNGICRQFPARWKR